MQGAWGRRCFELDYLPNQQFRVDTLDDSAMPALNTRLTIANRKGTMKSENKARLELQGPWTHDLQSCDLLFMALFASSSSLLSGWISIEVLRKAAFTSFSEHEGLRSRKS